MSSAHSSSGAKDEAKTPSPTHSPTIIDTDVQFKDGSDAAVPQKRVREVSLEPATPKPDDSDSEPVRMREKDSRSPAKKNKTHLSATAEELDADVEAAMTTDAPDPAAPAIDTGDVAVSEEPGVSGSPPHETKMRQISQGVEDIAVDKHKPELLKTPNTPLAPLLPEPAEAKEAAPPPDAHTPIPVDPPSPTKSSGSPGPSKRPRDDVDDDANPRETKRPTPPPASPKAGEASTATSAPKRSREDADKDANPRDTKRPTPPPPDEQPVASDSAPAPAPAAAPAQKPASSFGGGFLAYASTSSPFAAVKGPTLFGSRKSPSPWASAAAAGAKSPSPAPDTAAAPASPFAAASPPSSPKPTSAKRTGFEAFASASPFATVTARARSPARSKSPVRRAAAATTATAFSAYAGGGAQGLFGVGAPAAKRARAESPAVENEENGNEKKERSTSTTPDGEGKEKESEKSFREQLREDAQENGNGNGAERSVWGEPLAASSLDEKDLATGEEEERPVCSVRGKLFVLNGQNQWKERGTGTIRLNVKRDDESTPRLVMRKDAVLSVLLNAPLFKGMHCSIAQDPRYIRVSAIEAGALTHYNIRVGSSTAAETLHKAITAWTPGNDAQLAAWKREKDGAERRGAVRRP